LRQFMVAAFLVSWGVGGVGVLLAGPIGLGLGALCPGLVALWLTRRHQGSVRPLWRHVVRWRIGWRWYAVALGLPPLIVIVAGMGVRLAGGPWATPPDALPIAAVPVFLLAALVFFGGPEELGWRGYALPRLQSRGNALAASLILGLVWALWHAPLWFMPGLFFQDLSYPAYAVQIMAMTVVYTWLFNSTGGSILLAVVLHATTNTAASFAPGGPSAEWAVSAVWCGLALLLVAVHGPVNLAAYPRVDRERALGGPSPSDAA
jgi:uncharacterized protein